MELRKDYFRDRWVIIAEKRGSRPREFKKELKRADEVIESGLCYFCPGNEKTTPPEISRREKNSKWHIRVFPNKFPAVDSSGMMLGVKPPLHTEAIAAVGFHEIIVETPNHLKQLADLSADEIAEVLSVYAERIIANEKKGAKYVLVFKNHGRDGGTSLVHTHSQVVSLPVIPTDVKSELDTIKAYEQKHRMCPYCAIARNEAKKEIVKQGKKQGKKNSSRFPRFIHSSNGIACIAPYASRFNYEALILPSRHVARFEDLKKAELKGIAECLSLLLRKIRQFDASYNFYLRYFPRSFSTSAHLQGHLHIEFTPRIATWAGFELSSGIVINSVSPETAAEFYRT